MAKLAFSKLGLKVSDAVDPVMFGENTIEVKQYLPLEDKITLIQNVLNATVDDSGYYNPMKLNTFKVIEMIAFYTNISFTEKQRENPYKLYDQIVSSGLWDTLKVSIPISEWNYIEDNMYALIDNIYNYRNSMAGILENINTDYSQLDAMAEDIQKNLSDKENLTLVKDVLTKMG